MPNPFPLVPLVSNTNYLGLHAMALPSGIKPQSEIPKRKNWTLCNLKMITLI